MRYKSILIFILILLIFFILLYSLNKEFYLKANGIEDYEESKVNILNKKKFLGDY